MFFIYLSSLHHQCLFLYFFVTAKPTSLPKGSIKYVWFINWLIDSSLTGSGLLCGRPQHQRLWASGSAHQSLLLLQRLRATGLPGEFVCDHTSTLHISNPDATNVFPLHLSSRLCRAPASRCWQRAGLSTWLTFSRAPQSSITSSPAWRPSTPPTCVSVSLCGLLWLCLNILCRLCKQKRGRSFLSRRSTRSSCSKPRSFSRPASAAP